MGALLGDLEFYLSRRLRLELLLHLHRLEDPDHLSRFDMTSVVETLGKSLESSRHLEPDDGGIEFPPEETAPAVDLHPEAVDLLLRVDHVVLPADRNPQPSSQERLHLRGDEGIVELQGEGAIAGPGHHERIFVAVVDDLKGKSV